MDELMQMAVIELIRADAKGDSPNRVSTRASVDGRVRFVDSVSVRLVGKMDPICL